MWNSLPDELVEYIITILTNSNDLWRAVIYACSSKLIYTVYRNQREKALKSLNWDNDNFIRSLMNLKRARDPYYITRTLVYANITLPIIRNCKLSSLKLSYSQIAYNSIVPVLIVSPCTNLYIDVNVPYKLIIIGYHGSVIHISNNIDFTNDILIDHCVIRSHPDSVTDLKLDDMHSTMILYRCNINIPIKLKQGGCIIRACTFTPPNNDFNSTLPMRCFIQIQKLCLLHIYDSIICGSEIGLTIDSHSLVTISNSTIITSEIGCIVRSSSSLILNNCEFNSYEDCAIVLFDNVDVKMTKCILHGINMCTDIKCLPLNCDNIDLSIIDCRLLSTFMAISSTMYMQLKVNERTIMKGNVHAKVTTSIK